MKKYPHMCCDGHPEIGHSDSSSEMCPLCRALALLRRVEDEWADGNYITAATMDEVHNELGDDS